MVISQKKTESTRFFLHHWMDNDIANKRSEKNVHNLHTES